jgi:hypothetical protein
MSRQWTLGEVFVLRHAGFPFDWVESLGVSEPFRARVEALLLAEAELLALVKPLGADKTDRVRAELEKGRAPQKPSKAPEAYAPALERWKSLRAALERSFAEERAALRKRLHAFACDSQVQEAVFLSSPDMFDNVWARYVAEPNRPDNADARRVERQVYSYLQRFCAKNETTSFFGPMGYGEIEGEGEIEVKHLPKERRRKTFFAVWAIQELAKLVAKDKAFRAHLPLRVNPVFTFANGKAEAASLGLSVAVGQDEQRVLDALAKPRSLVELGKALGTDAATAQRLALPLLKSAVVVMGLQFNTHEFGVFQNLRAAVEALPQGEAQAKWLAQLDRLDALREAFQNSEFPARKAALLALEAAFTELTGVEARRGEGKMYSDRLIIYEEGGSPFRLRFGKEYAQALARALSPGLELSAAFGEKVQREYRQAVKEKLGAQTELDFLGYASRLRPDGVTGSQFSPVDPVIIPEGVSDARTLGDVLPPSSEGGRFALPDVCISGQPGPDGNPVGLKPLLGRVHHHLLVWNWLCAFYEHRPRLEGVARRWLTREPTAKHLTAVAFSRRNKGF